MVRAFPLGPGADKDGQDGRGLDQTWETWVCVSGFRRMLRIAHSSKEHSIT